MNDNDVKSYALSIIEDPVEKNLDIIRVKPFTDKNVKRFFQVQSTERTFFVPKKTIEENGSMMNIF